MKRLAIVFVSVLAACAAQAPNDVDGDGDGTGTGGGGGGGGGGGSGSGSGGGANTGGGMTASTYLEEMAQKYCDQAFACQATFPMDSGGAFADYFGASAAECVAMSAEYDDPTQIEAQITAGTIIYDSAAASACVTGLMFGACDTFWTEEPNVPAACSTALVGTVADGGNCVTTYECESLESYCDESSSECTPFGSP